MFRSYFSLNTVGTRLVVPVALMLGVLGPSASADQGHESSVGAPAAASARPTGKPRLTPEQLANGYFPIYDKAYTELRAGIQEWETDMLDLAEKTGLSYEGEIKPVGYALISGEKRLKFLGPATIQLPHPIKEPFEKTMERLRAERQQNGSFKNPPEDNFAPKALVEGAITMAWYQLLLDYAKAITEKLRRPGIDRLLTPHELALAGLQELKAKYGQDARAQWDPKPLDALGLQSLQFRPILARLFDGADDEKAVKELLQLAEIFQRANLPIIEAYK